MYEVYCLPECACEMEWVEIFDRYEPDAAENIRNVTPVYTTPQRQWVGLTDEEVRKTINDLNPRNSFIVASAIEAKLKEKNT